MSANLSTSRRTQGPDFRHGVRLPAFLLEMRKQVRIFAHFVVTLSGQARACIDNEHIGDRQYGKGRVDTHDEAVL